MKKIFMLISSVFLASPTQMESQRLGMPFLVIRLMFRHLVMSYPVSSAL